MGKAAIQPARKLEIVTPVVPRVELKVEEKPTAIEDNADELNKTFIVFFVHNKPVKVEIPDELTSEEVAVLVRKVK